MKMLYLKNAREILITLFVMCFCIACFGIATFFLFYPDKIIALLFFGSFFSIPAGVYYRKKWAYVIARTLCGLTAIVIVGFALNAFAYLDGGSGDTIWVYATKTLPFAVIPLTMFYCLNEHAKLRGI